MLPTSIDLPRSETDICVRAVFEATVAIVAAFVDETGAALDVSVAGKRTLLDAHGPVCLRKDRPASIAVQGPRGLVRFLVWISP